MAEPMTSFNGAADRTASITCAIASTLGEGIPFPAFREKKVETPRDCLDAARGTMDIPGVLAVRYAAQEGRNVLLSGSLVRDQTVGSIIEAHREANPGRTVRYDYTGGPKR